MLLTLTNGGGVPLIDIGTNPVSIPGVYFKTVFSKLAVL